MGMALPHLVITILVIHVTSYITQHICGNVFTYHFDVSSQPYLLCHLFWLQQMTFLCSPMHLQLGLISGNELINPAWAEHSKIRVAYVCNLECISLNILATGGKALIGTHEDVIYELLALGMIQPSMLSSYIWVTRKPSNMMMEGFLWHIAHARNFSIRWDFMVVVKERIIARLPIELYSC